MAVSQETSNPREEAQLLNNLGWVHLDRGDDILAEGYFRESVRVNNKNGFPLDGWFIDNGYQESDAEWEFPPKKD